MIVVDLGYYGHGMYDSPGALIEHYNPELLYGFDPLGEVGIATRDDTVVVTSTLAAWTHWGTVPFTVAGTGSRVGGGPHVPSFNLTDWLRTLPPPIVLKMDVEGGEWALCDALQRTQMDRHLELLLVETHGDVVLPELACPTEEWWM